MPHGRPTTDPKGESIRIRINDDMTKHFSDYTQFNNGKPELKIFQKNKKEFPMAEIVIRTRQAASLNRFSANTK